MIFWRFDKGVIDQLWRTYFPEAIFEHLVRIHFDYNHILLCC